VPKNRVPAASEDRGGCIVPVVDGGTLKGKILERAKLAFEEMAQGLGVCIFRSVNLGDPSSVPPTHIRWLIITCNWSPSGFNN